MFLGWSQVVMMDDHRLLSEPAHDVCVCVRMVQVQPFDNVVLPEDFLPRVLQTSLYERPNKTGSTDFLTRPEYTSTIFSRAKDLLEAHISNQ